MERREQNQWAVILGGSSGIGLAAAGKLAAMGLNLAIVHRDRASAMGRVDQEFAALRRLPVNILTFNVDALSEDGRGRILAGISELAAAGSVRVLLHSIALGNLKPLDELSDDDFAMTIYNMGTSLFSWVRELKARKLFAGDARVLGLTSEGSQIAWNGYAAVAAAKSCLESVSRAIAKEFAPFGIRSNIIQAGVTETPALRLIPGHETIAAAAAKRNPLGRLTRPEDVANVIGLLCSDEAAWINGTIITVDGGERISG